MHRDVFQDIAAILNPQPHQSDDMDEDVYSHLCSQAWDKRQTAAADMETNWDEGSADPLLSALAAARKAKEQAEDEIQQLIAYGREFVQPRPYTLNDLASAAGMSISGARTAYSHGDVETVAQTTGAKPREWRASDEPTDPTPPAPSNP